MVVENPDNILISLKEPSTQDYVPREDSPECKSGYSSETESTDSSVSSSKYSEENSMTENHQTSPTFDEIMYKTTISEEDHKKMGTNSSVDKEFNP